MLKDKFKYLNIKVLKSKLELFSSFINLTKKSDYLSWKLNDDKSLKEWFTESTINVVSASLVLVAVGAAATWSLSQYNVVPFTFKIILANTTIIWFSLRLVEILKKK